MPPVHKVKWKKNKKDIFPQKGIVVMLLKDGMCISGKGFIQAVKDTQGKYIFTATLVKDYKNK